MNNLWLILIGLCGFFTSKEIPQNSKWHFKDPITNKQTTEVYKHEKNETILPYIWVKSKNTLLDSMTERGLVYDSIMNLRTTGLSENFADVVISFLPDSMLLVYSGANTIQLGDCHLSYQIFQIYPKPTYADDDVFELYYLKGLGIFAAVHVNVEYFFNEWSYYSLQDLKDKKGKSVIDRTKLKALVDTVINRRIKI